MRRLYFRNFPPQYTDEQVRNIFESFGRVQRFKLLLDADGASTGSGLVTLEDEAANAAIKKLHGSTFEGTKVFLEPARGEGSEAHRGLAAAIASRLGETEDQPQQTIHNLIKVLGPEYAEQLLDETLQVEAEGGLMVPDGSRRRTVGGVFFHLLKQRMDNKTFYKIFTGSPAQEKKKNGTQPSKHSKGGKPDQKKQVKPQGGSDGFAWSKRLAAFQNLIPERGTATTVKMTLVGRPGKIKKMKDLTILAMEHTIKNLGLPKGVPQPPQTPTLYTVYIGAKQWSKVEEALKNPDDVLIVEGQGAFDQELQAMALFGTNVTTKLLQQSAKAAQQPVAQKPAQAAPAPKTTTSPAKTPAAPQPAKPAPSQRLNQEQAQALMDNLQQQLVDVQGKLQRKEGSAFSLSQQAFKLEQEIKDLRKMYPGLK